MKRHNSKENLTDSTVWSGRGTKPAMNSEKTISTSKDIEHCSHGTFSSQPSAYTEGILDSKATLKNLTMSLAGSDFTVGSTEYFRINSKTANVV